MKTEKEIEKLAETLYPTVTMYTQPLRKGFVDGYTQCQQDMDKKYTEEDVIDLFKKFGVENRNIPEDKDSWIELKSEHIEEWIHNKLNKQDNEHI